MNVSELVQSKKLYPVTRRPIDSNDWSIFYFTLRARGERGRAGERRGGEGREERRGGGEGGGEGTEKGREEGREGDRERGVGKFSTCTYA